MQETPRDRVVVLGGSIAGLLAARVLAEAYADVVVVERDELPQAAVHRRGVPQSRHIHGLLAAGQQALEQLFDGLTAELVDLGAPAGDMLKDVRCCFGGHRLRSGPSGLLALQASRPLLEHCLRARVRALPSVRFVDRCDVAGLTSTADGGRVTGARVVRRVDGSAEQTLTADLVVDATGRGSRTPAWLEKLGYPRPPVERVQIGIGYASRTYRRVPGLLGGDLAILNAATPDHPRGGAMAAMENDRLLVTLYGILGDHPPTDPVGFADFAATLQFRDINEVLRDAEPLDDPIPFRHPASVRYRYERLSTFPDGLLVMGDAVCTFNPIYGQGMSMAALQALALRAHVQQHTRPQPVTFFRQIGRVVDLPWSMATGGDLAFPAVVGQRSLQMRLLNGYLAKLHAGAAHDPQLGRAFLRVAGLVDPPQALLAPGVAARVLKSSVPRSRSAQTDAPDHRADRQLRR
ncbi:FAD-dependent monooxygenase [Kribbella sp. NPDC003505]|uniref:FAD-dependent oxidoreductase n=1 Tax=Kribbella sp. NPDC003505 TaxID=3154448 RepID=UPI0033A1DAD4